MLQRPRQSKRARFRNTVRQLLRDLVATNARRRRLIRVPGPDHRLLRTFKNLPQQNSFELPRDFADFLFLAQLRIAREFFGRNIRGLDATLDRRNIHITG